MPPFKHRPLSFTVSQNALKQSVARTPLKAKGDVSGGEVIVEKFVGIDVFMDTLDVCIDSIAETLRFANDDGSIAQFVKHLSEVAPTLIVVKAAGGIEMRLASELAARSLPVAVINALVPQRMWPA